MGLITGLVTLPVAPVKGVLWVAEKITEGWPLTRPMLSGSFVPWMRYIVSLLPWKR